MSVLLGMTARIMVLSSFIWRFVILLTKSMSLSVMTLSVRVLKVPGMSMMLWFCLSGPQSSILRRSSLKCRLTRFEGLAWAGDTHQLADLR